MTVAATAAARSIGTAVRCAAATRAVAAALLLGAAAAALAEPGAARRAELTHLLRHDCGSCHGMTLAGGLGPPLTAVSLRDTPLAALEAAILHGRPGTPMPPWRDLLSVDDVRWLAHALKTGRLQ